MSEQSGVDLVEDMTFVETTEEGGNLRVIASIEQPEVITKILAHLERVAPERYSAEWPLGARAPPSQARLL